MTTPTFGWSGKPPAGVVLGLDDTVYPQAAYLYGAARAVGRAGAAAGLDQVRPSKAVRSQLVAGWDGGGTIRRALAACGVPPGRAGELLPAMVAAFTGYRPRFLPLYVGAGAALAALADRFPLVCLTDGIPAVQRAKLAATGVAGIFAGIVLTGEPGGRPHPEGLRTAAGTLGIAPVDLVLVGGRPGTDMAMVGALGARSIQVRTGEYAESPDSPAATAVVADLPAAAALLLRRSLEEK